MSVHYESRVIGEIRAASVHGHEGLGLSQLRFVIDWNLHAKREDTFTVFGTSIWVSARADGESQWRMLGHAMPEIAWSDESKDGDPFDRPVQYRLTLPDSQLLVIEHARKGGAVSFQLEVRGHVHGPRGIRSLSSTEMLKVTASDWVRVLQEANAAEVLLVGVQLPAAGNSGKCRAAIELIRKANIHLLQGNYDAAVAQCRLAIESLWRATALESQARAARKLLASMAERMSMTKLDRELALGEALLNFTHPAHHVGADAEPEMFGRLDAALVVAATAGLVSSVAALPDRVSPQVAEIQPRRVATPAIKAPASSTNKTPGPSISDQVARVQENLAASKPRTMKSLRTAVHSWLGKPEAHQIDLLMDELRKRKIFVEENGRPKYPDFKK